MSKPPPIPDETTKLAIAASDAVVTTHERLMDTREHVREQKQRLDKATDAAGERTRAAELAMRFENWAAARVSPRRRRHAKITAFDERAAELEARMAALAGELNEIRERIPVAEAEHQAAVTRWHAEGAKGARPESPVPALEARLREAQEDRAALETLLGEVLIEKTRYVESHRDALARDAAAEVQDAAAGYRQAIERVAQAREELIAARRDELYFALYPDEAVRSEPPAAMLVGGIPARLRTAVPGLTVTFGVPELRRLLEADVEFLTSMLTPQQQEALRARDSEATRGDREAFWAQTDEGQAALRRERQEARERYRREWGQEPGW